MTTWMTWVRVQPDAPTHSKFFRAGVAAFGFDIAGIAYCLRHLTDGFIPVMDLGLIYPGTPPGRTIKLVTALVEVGRWRVVEGGWRIHDYEQFQPTKEDILEEQRRHHEKSVAGGKARASIAQRIKGRFTTGAHPAKAPATHQPPPGGVLDQPAPARTSLIDVDVDVVTTTPHTPQRTRNGHSTALPGFAEFYEHYPRKKAPGQARKAWTLAVKKATPGEIMAALKQQLAELVGRPRDKVPYPASWLNGEQWRNEPDRGAQVYDDPAWPRLYDCAQCGQAHETPTHPVTA